MGKPVIVTNISAHRTILGNSKCGLFVPDNHPVNLAYGIKRSITKASELPALGKLARKKAIENMTWERQAEKITDYFIDLLKDDRGCIF
jgi:glycosyltransferase involved in cell wall biosynthesis